MRVWFFSSKDRLKVGKADPEEFAGRTQPNTVHLNQETQATGSLAAGLPSASPPIKQQRGICRLACPGPSVRHV